MYASIIGKKLVAVRNKKENKERSIREFWEDVYIPLFFDHPKYMMTAGNTPLENPKFSQSNLPDKNSRNERIQKLLLNISKGYPDTTNSLGFGSDDPEATTSGQISSLTLPLNEEDIYSSWIGLGLGVGVSGGLVFLFDDEEILNTLFEGWFKYRDYLQQTKKLKGNQIETWNGHWLSYALKNKRSAFDLPISDKKEFYNIPTIEWVNVVFSLAVRFPEKNFLTYLYSLGQTNTTIGFIQLKLPEVKREIDLCHALFAGSKELRGSEIDAVYKTEFTLKAAARNGSIGLREIEPKDLRQYMADRTGNPKTINTNNLSNYFVYLSWISAMLNSKTTIEFAEQTAEKLIEFVDAERRLVTRTRLIDELLQSKTRQQFIAVLVQLINQEKSNADFFNSLVHEVDNLNSQNFSYFLTLLNFKYTFLSNK